MYGRVWGEDVQKNLFSPRASWSSSSSFFSFFFRLFSACFLSSSAHHSRFLFSFFAHLFTAASWRDRRKCLPVSIFFPWEKKGKKNKEKDSLRVHSIIRPHSLTLFSVFFLFLSRAPAPNTPSLTSIRLHTRPMRTIFDLSTAPVLLLVLLKSADDAVM